MKAMKNLHIKISGLCSTNRTLNILLAMLLQKKNYKIYDILK